MGGEVVHREFRAMESVVEDRRLAETLREKGRDLRNEVALSSGKGEGDAEAFRARCAWSGSLFASHGLGKMCAQRGARCAS
jgi:hypothetical protein